MSGLVQYNRRQAWFASAVVAVAVSAIAQSASAQADSIAEVVVTAQKRSENIRDVPATITALSEDQLAVRGLDSTIELQHATPGVTFGTSASFTNFYIRGLGNAFSTPAAQSPVAFYLDGVYIADVSSTIFGLADVDHIEILKGPQGTLYGRNAVGGAINIITKTPSEDFQLKLQGTLGNYNNREISAYVNGGTDLVQANFSIDLHKRDGYYKNLTPGGRDANSVNEANMRGKLRFTPSDNADIILAVDYTKNKGYGYAGGNTMGYPETFGPGTTVVPTGVLLGGAVTERPWRTTYVNDLSNDIEHWGAAITGRFDLGAVDLVSITSYRDFTIKHGLPLDGASSNAGNGRLHDFHRNFSQEIQLLSDTDGRFSWIAGAYYLHDDAGFDPLHINQNIFFPLAIDIFSKVRSNAYALFGEGTYKLTDNLSVVLGARYSHDETTHYQAIQNITLPFPPFLIPTNSSGAEKSWSAVTPRVSLKYERPEGIYYASWSKGYRAGLFNVSNVAPTVALDNSVAPEKVDAYEIGAKWSFLDNKVHLDVAGFYYDDKNMQLQSLQAFGTTAFQNAAGEIKGVDVDAEWLVTSGLTLRAGFEVLDAEYTSFKAASVYVPHSTLFAGAQQGVAPCPGDLQGTTLLDSACSVSRDLTGRRMMRSPKFTGMIAADWELPLPDDMGSALFSASLYHSDRFLTTANATQVSPAYNLVNLSLRYTLPDERWSVLLFGTNVGNAKYYVTGGEQQLSRIVMYGEPRMYGVTLTYRMGR